MHDNEFNYVVNALENQAAECPREYQVLIHAILLLARVIQDNHRE